MKTYHLRGKDMELPENIEELTPSQYEEFLCLASAWSEKAISIDYFREMWLSELVGLVGLSYTQLLPDYANEIEDVADEVLSGFFVDDAPILNTCVNMLPMYLDHDGPGDWLEGMNFGDFTECVSLLEMAVSGGHADPDSMYRRITQIMYGIGDTDYIKPVLVFHSVLLLCSVWQAIQTEPVDIDGQEIDMSIIFKPTGDRRADDGTGWKGLIMEVAQAGLFGQVDDVRSAPLWDVLLYLYKCKFEIMHENNDKSH